MSFVKFELFVTLVKFEIFVTSSTVSTKHVWRRQAPVIFFFFFTFFGDFFKIVFSFSFFSRLFQIIFAGRAKQSDELTVPPCCWGSDSLVSANLYKNVTNVVWVSYTA